MYNYVKALHIIFIVTWFSGMFFISSESFTFVTTQRRMRKTNPNAPYLQSSLE